MRSFSSKNASFQSCNPSAQYLTASAHHVSISVSGSNFAFHLDFANFSHLAANKNPETIILLKGIFLSLKYVCKVV
ncbi:MAG: hypothetical protein WCG25_04890 [bacterium]